MIFRLRFVVHADGEGENGEVSIIPCTITSKMGTNNYQPTPVEGTEEYKKVMKKIAKYSSVSKETATALKASR